MSPTLADAAADIERAVARFVAVALERVKDAQRARREGVVDAAQTLRRERDAARFLAAGWRRRARGHGGGVTRVQQTPAVAVRYIGVYLLGDADPVALFLRGDMARTWAEANFPGRHMLASVTVPRD